eukprot:s8518_g2.t1
MLVAVRDSAVFTPSQSHPRQAGLLQALPALHDTQINWLLLSCCAAPRAQFALRSPPPVTCLYLPLLAPSLVRPWEVWDSSQRGAACAGRLVVFWANVLPVKPPLRVRSTFWKGVSCARGRTVSGLFDGLSCCLLRLRTQPMRTKSTNSTPLVADSVLRRQAFLAAPLVVLAQRGSAKHPCCQTLLGALYVAGTMPGAQVAALGDILHDAVPSSYPEPSRPVVCRLHGDPDVYAQT